eukprot:9587728-Lingulodinium_polyedra.AAC.1
MRACIRETDGLGLQPKSLGEACYEFWQGGDLIKNGEPQRNQVFCQVDWCIPEVVTAVQACIREADRLGLQPKSLGEACHEFWQGGDLIKNGEPQRNQVFCQMNWCIPEVVAAVQ